jgi:hypothetical protein
MYPHTQYAKDATVVAFMAIVAVYALLLGANWSIYQGGQLAAVGVSVGIAPTETNTKLAQIAQKEQELAEREALLQTTQVTLQENTPLSIIYTTVMGLVLLLLVLLNFYLDYRRRPLVT